MKEPDEQALKSFIETGADILGLPIDPEWMPSIKGHLLVTLGHAALVAELELPDEAESAAVFRA